MRICEADLGRPCRLNLHSVFVGDTIHVARRVRVGCVAFSDLRGRINQTMEYGRSRRWRTCVDSTVLGERMRIWIESKNRARSRIG
jgi:hypothetical protein